MGETTPTDSRSQRNRASRRGGHLTTRAHSPPHNTGLPTPFHSQCPYPGRSHRTPPLDITCGSTDKAAPPSFIPANNPIEADHGQLKHRLRPMRGLRTDQSAQVVIGGHAFVQNLRRGHYELAVDAPVATRLATAFTELAQAI